MPIKVFLVLFLSSFVLTACNVNTRQAQAPIVNEPIKTLAKTQLVQKNTPPVIAKKVTAPPPTVINKTSKPVVSVVSVASANLPILIDEEIEQEKIVVEELEYRDAWWHIKNSNVLPIVHNRYFRAQLNWFANHQEYLNRVARRAEPYLYYIIEELKKQNMPLELALLPIVESGFQPFAYSHGSAAGMWQFIPATGRLYGLKQNWWYDGRRDAIKSTQAAIKLLKRLGKRYNNDWLLALAAYNWGPGNVNRAIRYNKKRNKGTSFWDLKLPPETKNYIPKLLALKELINHPEKHGIKWFSIAYRPTVKLVKSSTQIDLALVAKLADVPIETVYRYNSGFNRWATPPNGPHEILLPIEAANKFEQGLAKTPKHKRVTWKRHKIKKGETLSHIARKYHTTIAQIRSLNNLYKKTIRAGSHIVVPTAGKKQKSYSLSSHQRLKSIKSTPRSGKKVTITIRKGDTFWDLSQQYKVSIRNIAKWNGLAPKDRLKIGQKLVIWTKSRRHSVRHVLFNNPHINKLATKKTINYSVRRGDSLARIANKFKVSVVDLKRWNKKIKHKKYILPGQKLRLYIDIRKQSG